MNRLSKTYAEVLAALEYSPENKTGVQKVSSNVVG